MRKILLLAGIILAVFVLAACESEPPDTGFVYDVPSLGAIWEPYFPLGNIVAVQHRDDLTNARRIAVLRRHFEIVTAENAMKPAYLQPSRGNFSFGNSNRVINFANNNGMRVHGHTLIWHGARQNQSGFSGQDLTWMGNIRNRAEKIQVLQNHITRVVQHFGDNIESWCVVNEAFTSGGGRRDGAQTPPSAATWTHHLRNTSWFEIIGPEFIEIAFIAARDANPNLVLYYNDYNLNMPAKRMAVYHMVRDINARHHNVRGRPLIDAIGMQGHYHLGGGGAAYPWGPINVNQVRDSIMQFANLDLSYGISITELDVTAGNSGSLTSQQERQQAEIYARLFQVFRENSQHIRRISIWGIDDPVSWRSRGSPLLFDARFRPKEAFWAVADPDAFLANPDAFLANPRASTFIPASAW